LSRDREWLEEVLRRRTEGALELSADGGRIPTSALRDLPSAGIRRVLLSLARSAGGDGFAPTRRELLALEKLAARASDFRFQAGRRGDFVATRGELRALRARKKSRENSTGPECNPSSR